jgi:hypothetical protein
VAIDQLEALMLSEAWDAIPPERQHALAEITEQMRADVKRLATEVPPTSEPFADED